MDKCAEIREMLAMNACGLLDDAEKAQVSAHLSACRACSEYARSIQAVSASIAAIDRDADRIEPPADMHERLAAAVRKAANKPSPRLTLWKVATLAASLAIVAFSLYFALAWHAPIHGTTPTAKAADALPTFATYRRAASLDSHDLDALLDMHARFCPRGEPAGTAGRAFLAPNSGAWTNSKEAYHET